MGKYRLGEILYMTRKSLAITQEELCSGICSVETLSRVENGRQTPSKETYELLMQRMGRNQPRAFSILSISNYSILDKLKKFEDCIDLLDYVKAEEVLQEIKKSIGNTYLDNQFMLRAEALISFRLKKITANEFLNQLLEAIRISIPQFGIQPIGSWPLNTQETLIILNISTAYAHIGNHKRCIKILKEAIETLDGIYQDDYQRVILAAMLSNLSKWYGLLDKHKLAIQAAQKGIEVCKIHKIGSILVTLYYSISWNMLEMIHKKELPENERYTAFQYLKKSHYISAAMHHPYAEKLTMQLYNHEFKDYINDVLLF